MNAILQTILRATWKFAPSNTKMPHIFIPEWKPFISALSIEETKRTILQLTT